jgi:anti-sigma factor RsiW
VSCKKTIDEISSYLDGELAAELKQSIETHLKKCRHCQIVFDTTRKTIELYCDGELFPLPDDVRRRLHEALQRRCQTRSK